MSDKPSAIFAFPAVWDEVFKEYADVYRAIDKVQLIVPDLIKATQDDKSELMVVLRSLTSANDMSMTDVVILTGNRRGVGSMKIARSMFEVSITAGYLEKNPAATDLYLDFTHITSWRYVQGYERMYPGEVSAEHKREAEAQYNRVKGKFEKNGKVRNNWSGKDLKEMAEAIGPDRADLYDIVYRLGSDLHHVSIMGLIGHELKWEAEALRVGHGTLLQTLVSLYNAYHKAGTEFRDRIDELAKEFDRVWAKIRAGKK